jgi:hypothetical protein
MSGLLRAAVQQRVLPLPRLAYRSPFDIARALSTESFFISRNSKSEPVQVSRSFIAQSRERVLSGIQPTGVPHIGINRHPCLPHITIHQQPDEQSSDNFSDKHIFAGNYFGALKQWASLQCDDQVF